MSDLFDEVMAMERGVWAALAAGDARTLRAALAEDFEGLYPDGGAGREDLIAALATGPTVAAYELSQERARPMGDDHALLTYHARFRRAGQTGWEAMRVSSIWRRAGTGWENTFSQDTPEGPPVP
jgi:hypothetical protein